MDREVGPLTRSEVVDPDRADQSARAAARIVVAEVNLGHIAQVPAHEPIGVRPPILEVVDPGIVEELAKGVARAEQGDLDIRVRARLA